MATVQSVDEAEQLRRQIAELVREYHRAAFPRREFEGGKTLVPVAGRVFDSRELELLVESSLDFWLTTGRFSAEFEKRFSREFGRRYAALVNSGSSANLLALSCLTAPFLGDRRLLPGDEVITAAAGFPTTVNPIVQNQLVPVFLDSHLPTYNIDVTQLEEARTDRTRAIMVAHTLGNPFELDAVVAFAKKYNLWLIEDCCDAVGSTYRGKQVGTFGDLATVSFYPAHHLTMGEGGCVLYDRPVLDKLVTSFRDWGRDCWCAPGQDNTCGKRFDQQLGDLPHGYDHKYTYSHLGYNLKLTDMQAAVGVAQLDKLASFTAARRKNFAFLYEALRPLQDVFTLPESVDGAEPSWFGFPLAVRPESGLKRDTVVRALEARRIQTRLLFAGNLTKQPVYRDVNYRTVGDLRNADYIMENVFWIGVYPGLTDDMLHYVVESLQAIVKG
ncbi:MAG: lipopolysaccharide biosynthesis protein RfbH [Pirellula sp.]|nr:lipopolysaccharide biosynthesis protein RfbH [Pirellula sp.]